jgi:anti-sigma B factor antagonist
MLDAARPDRSSDSAGPGARGADDAGFVYEVGQDDDRVVVVLEGELDLASAPALQRALLALVDRPVAALTLDLGALSFLDSSGLGALYRTRQAADAQGITFRLVRVPDHVMRVLDVTAMAPRFDLDPGSD